MSIKHYYYICNIQQKNRTKYWFFLKIEYVLVLICSFIICGCGISKTIKNDMEIEEISLYEHYREGGTTTAGAVSIFNNLQADNVRTIKIDNSELEMIRTILSSSIIVKYPKWFQRKTGIYLLFFEFKETGGNKHRIYLSYDGAFVDIDNNVVFRVENKEQRIWIRHFQEKYRDKHLDWI